MKLEEEIDEIVTLCWTDEISLIDDKENSKSKGIKEKFDVMMSDEVG